MNERGIGFWQFEDVALCKAFVNATQNSVLGSEKKADAFCNSAFCQTNLE